MTEIAQPNASQMPAELLEAVLQSTAMDSSPAQIIHRDQHSNDFAEVRLNDGRRLIVKRARYDWAEARFRTSRIASELIRERTEVSVPAPLPVPAAVDERAVEAYWRIDQPTLQEIWPQLEPGDRQRALESWGEMISRLHGVRLEGFGPLSDPTTPQRSLETYLLEELEHRLLPAVAGVWPIAFPAVKRLARQIEKVAARSGERSRLVHNDMHMGNVLCDLAGGSVRCFGMIDLETAVALPPESDLAVMQLHHGELFEQPIGGDWFDAVSSGYSEDVDARAIAFFRGYHLANMGFYSALIGHDWHAERVAAALTRETAALERWPSGRRG